MANTVFTGDLLALVEYKKEGREVREKLYAKIAELQTKIEERKARIAKARDEHGIDDTALVVLLQRYIARQRAGSVGTLSYRNDKTGREAEVEAGVVAQLQTEQAALDNEAEQVAKLQRVARNIPRDASVTVALSYDDLVYLGY